MILKNLLKLNLLEYETESFNGKIESYNPNINPNYSGNPRSPSFLNLDFINPNNLGF